jgi:signal transduction histidine kinase
MSAEELRTAFLTAGLSEEQRFELFAASDEVEFRPDEVLFVEGEPADFLFMLLEGSVELARHTGSETTVLATMSAAGQWAGGLRAWSGDGMGGTYRATGRAVSDGRVLKIPSDEVGRLVERWFPFGKHIITGIFQTIRSIEATVRQREALIALGTLAAGLAHEINNPAAASLRAVTALRRTCDAMLSSLTHLAEIPITADQYVALNDLRVEATAPQTGPAPDGALAFADREERVGLWLADHKIDDAWQLASSLATVGLDVDWCARVEARIGQAALGPGLQWIASTVAANSLLDEVQETTTRISDLVEAVKSYSQMDRASLQRVDVHDGLESTLVMLSHKLDGIEVERNFGDVPDIDVYAGELNQVWTNLLDNAIDAMHGGGTVRIDTRVDDGSLCVDISDTGHGMPDDVVERAFEPFFTTKGVGKGTGLGLDIARRIVVDRHGGSITFTSSSSGTMAHVRIPLSR